MTPKDLISNPFPETKWKVEDKPVAIIDGKLHRLNELNEAVIGSVGYVVGINQATFFKVCELIDVNTLQFYEMKVPDMGQIVRIKNLRKLSIRWNTKLTDIGFMRDLKNLKYLVLEDTPKVTDLSPLTGHQSLEFLEFAGGMNQKNCAVSLRPLSTIPNLKELSLSNVKVLYEGIIGLNGTGY